MDVRRFGRNLAPAVVSGCLSASLLTLLPVSGYAQSKTVSALAKGFQIVPGNKPEYAQLRAFCSKGMLDGIPADQDPFGGRTVNRAEMASLVNRLITYLENEAKRVKADPSTRTPIPVEDLRTARELLKEYRPELELIGLDLKTLADSYTDIVGLTDDEVNMDLVLGDINSLAVRLIDPTKEGDEFSRLATGKQNKNFSGYIQARWDYLTGPSELYNSSGSGGTGQRPTKSGPSVGGPRSGFQVRRANFKFNEVIQKHGEYVIQLDVPTTSSVSLRDAFVRVLNFPAKNMALRVGQYTFDYGFEYSYSSRNNESPERALGFSDSSSSSAVFKSSQNSTGGVFTPGSVRPFFDSQDRDQGLELAYSPEAGKTFKHRYSVSVIDGDGRSNEGQRSLDGTYDVVGHAEFEQKLGKSSRLSGGLSYYTGGIPVRETATPSGGTPGPFKVARREFGGGFLRYLINGMEFRAEYSGGKYETTPDRSSYLPGNKFSAWYVAARIPIAKKLELYSKFDHYDPTNKDETLGTGQAINRTDYRREALRTGLIYNYTTATRFRVNYTQGLTPFDPTAPDGSAQRKKLGLFIFEVQQAF